MPKSVVHSRTKSTPNLSECGIGHVGLRVSNLKESCSFYQEILGLSAEVKNSRTAVVRTGPDVIVLFEDDPESPKFHFGFRLDSSKQVDWWRKRIESHKLPIYQDIRERGHPRSFKIRDPDGHLVEISSSK